MTDIGALVEGLSSKFELSNQSQDKLVSSLRSRSARVVQPESRSTQSTIGLSPVSTFVAEKSFSNFAVPHFATHWGVVCDFPNNSRTLFHLLYDPSARKMLFDFGPWREEWSKHSVTPVGTTPYEFTQVNWIGCSPPLRPVTYATGKELLKGFEELGSYHFIFWNCQTFTKLFLQILCHPQKVDIPDWTTAEVMRLVPVFEFIKLIASLFVRLLSQVRSLQPSGAKNLQRCKGWHRNS